MCLLVVVPLSPIADGVTDEENAEEFADQYRELEPKGQCHNQDFPEGFEDGKFNPTFDAYFVLVFMDTTYWPIL